MIEINLLPAQLRKKKRILPKLPSKVFLLLPSVIIGVLICLHIIFLVVGILLKNQVSSLDRQLQAISGQKKEADSIKMQLGLMEGKLGGITQIAESRLLWAQKLNKISDNLSLGLWLTRLSINDKTFTLEGSVVSLKSEEMSLVRKFLQDLKNDNSFFADFIALDLKSIQRRFIKVIEVVDFIIIGTLK